MQPSSKDQLSKKQRREARGSTKTAKKQRIALETKLSHIDEYDMPLRFELIRHPDEHVLMQLEKPILETTARITVSQLKKFLRLRLNLSPTADFDLFLSNHMLGPEHNLLYVLKLAALDPTATFQIYYRLRAS
jgi:hypothetical protein